MIYTLGHRSAYLVGISEGTEERPFLKTGWHRRINGEEYPGGSVWKTSEEVWAHIDSQGQRLTEHSVFAIDAEWESGTLTSPNPWRSLANDSRIVKEILRRVN